MKLPKNAHLWLPGYARQRLSTIGVRDEGITDILFCIADHFEPEHGAADMATQRRRVRRWLRELPRLASRFRDADGLPPQHTFFSPQEAYREEQLDILAELCHSGFGEVEVHLHHDGDTSSNLRCRLESFAEVLAARHGLLGLDARGNVSYGFVHGNWALDNSHPDGKWCGVNDELTILQQTGCYADFTMPAAPDPAQSRMVNSIYYAQDDPDRPRSHDRGAHIRVGGQQPPASLMMIQGPLALRWDARRHGLIPRVDSGTLDAGRNNRPTLERFRRWVHVGICVADRPRWVFVKVHSHGAKDANADVLLGEEMHRFHEEIQRACNDGTRYRLHYVTARELYNIAKAAEQGASGNPGLYRDYSIQTVRRGARRPEIRLEQAVSA